MYHIITQKLSIIYYLSIYNIKGGGEYLKTKREPSRGNRGQEGDQCEQSKLS